MGHRSLQHPQSRITSPRSKPQQFKPRDLFHPREHVAEFVRRLAAPVPYRGKDRRREPRYQLATDIAVVPVNDQLDPAGEQVRCILRDVSASGASFYSGHPLDTKLLVLHLATHDGERMSALLEVVRRDAIGQMSVIAGKFMTKLYQGSTLHL